MDVEAESMPGERSAPNENQKEPAKSVADYPVMTAAETLDLARSHGVEVRLNDAGDGLDLEVEPDPPQALLSIIRSACLACRSQSEGGLDRLERRFRHHGLHLLRHDGPGAP